jgi:hypothetical protein
MNHIHDAIWIDAPVDHAWALLCDTSRWHDWDPRSEYSDWSGPVDEIGTTVTETGRLMGWEFKATDTVVEVEPQRLIHIRSESGGSPMDAFYRFEPECDATLLTVEADYEMPRHIPEFIKSLFTKGWVERYTRQQLEAFKALAEASVPVSA